MKAHAQVGEEEDDDDDDGDDDDAGARAGRCAGGRLAPIGRRRVPSRSSGPLRRSDRLIVIIIVIIVIIIIVIVIVIIIILLFGRPIVSSHLRDRIARHLYRETDQILLGCPYVIHC